MSDFFKVITLMGCFRIKIVLNFSLKLLMKKEIFFVSNVLVETLFPINDKQEYGLTIIILFLFIGK